MDFKHKKTRVFPRFFLCLKLSVISSTRSVRVTTRKQGSGCLPSRAQGWAISIFPCCYVDRTGPAPGVPIIFCHCLAISIGYSPSRRRAIPGLIESRIEVITRRRIIDHCAVINRWRWWRRYNCRGAARPIGICVRTCIGYLCYSNPSCIAFKT